MEAIHPTSVQIQSNPCLLCRFRRTMVSKRLSTKLPCPSFVRSRLAKIKSWMPCVKKPEAVASQMIRKNQKQQNNF